MDFGGFSSLSGHFDEMVRASLLLRDQLKLNESSTVRALLEAKRQADLVKDVTLPMREVIDRPFALTWPDGATVRAAQGYFDSPTMREALGNLDSYAILASRSLLDSPSGIAARELAERASMMSLPAALSDYRSSIAVMTERLALFDHHSLMRDGLVLDAFARSSAISNALSLTTRVDMHLMEASRVFSQTILPDLGSLTAYRTFFDAAGLRLPRLPRIRLLTAAEKRRRFKARLQRNAEPPHVKKAKSLVHTYERVLREIIDTVMAATYGEDWARERLPLCNSKTLLGRVESKGGEALDHADYAHYRDIMSHSQHFAEIFHVAFDDPQTIINLMNDAGRLRARSHHAHDFSSNDLRDLRVVWRTIELGLLALMDDVVVDY